MSWSPVSGKDSNPANLELFVSESVNSSIESVPRIPILLKSWLLRVFGTLL